MLHGENVDSYINIDFDIEKLNLIKGHATYNEIKTYVLDKYGFKVPSLYIAQTKEKFGIHERENYNIGSGKTIVSICPKEKENAIMDAFRHFNLIK